MLSPAAQAIFNRLIDRHIEKMKQEEADKKQAPSDCEKQKDVKPAA